MRHSLLTPRLDRRSILKTGLVLGVAQIAGPFIIKARGEEPIKIGMVERPVSSTEHSPQRAA